MLAEYGHIPLLQRDGSYATLENLISGNAITLKYGDVMYRNQTPRYQEHWDKIGRDFGRGIATLAPVIGMSAVVIGGGVSRNHERYEGALRAELAIATGSIPVGVVAESPLIKFVPHNMIDEIGLYGAFEAIRQRFKELA